MMTVVQQRAPDKTPLDLLRRPESYPDRPSGVQLIETHISWVFLTDRYAYKLKKPVRFEFLDFSTESARHEACEEELRLNRRMAPHVYLKVVPITCDSRGRLNLGGTGTPVDWVVKMRRLPEERTLEALARAGNLQEAEIEEVAQALARFYSEAAPLTERPEQYREEIEHHVRANREALLESAEGADATRVKRIHSAQLRFLRLAPQLLDERVCDGRIVEGHGDLRPEHIYLEATPVIIDCVEFSAELRQLDVADELCFLAMECERIGATAIGDRVLDCYCRTSGDHPPQALLAFYKSYRACVRAKVSALRAAQLNEADRAAAMSQVEKYLVLADKHAARLGPPLLIVTGGLMGTGKSTLAAELSETLHTELASTDVIRREMVGPSTLPAEYGKGHYEPETREQVYDRLFDRAEQLLGDRLSVVLDGTFLTNQLRLRAVELAQKFGAAPLVVRCECPEQVACARIADRLAAAATPSEGRPDLYRLLQKEEEPVPPDLPHLVVDTTTSIQAQVQAVLAWYRASIDEQ